MNGPAYIRHSPEWWAELVQEPIEVRVDVRPDRQGGLDRRMRALAYGLALERRRDQMDTIKALGLPQPDEATFGGYGSPGTGTVRVLRYDKTCDECKGSGRTEWTDGGGWAFVDTCPYCKGEGWREPGKLKPIDEGAYEPPLYLLLGIGSDGRNYGEQ